MFRFSLSGSSGAGGTPSSSDAQTTNMPRRSRLSSNPTQTSVNTTNMHAQDPVPPRQKAATEPMFRIALKRDTYYDNDSVEGTLTIESQEEAVYPNISVALVCRFVCKDYASHHYKKAHTIFRSVKTVGRDFFIRKGTTNISVTFNMPANEPASFDHKLCTVRWDVRLVRSGEKGAHTLARCGLRKASLYYPIPGHRPTAQADRKFFLSQTPQLRVEASLSRDVFNTLEPVEVNVVIHNTSRALSINKVRAELVQHAQAWDKTMLIVDKQYILDTSKHDVKAWAKGKVESDIGAGVVFEKTFSLLPQLDDEFKAAKQEFVKTNGETALVLAPTATSSRTSKGLLVTLRYHVAITVSITGCSDVRLVLPFSLENSITETDPASNTPTHALQVGTPQSSQFERRFSEGDCTVFPMIEDPPSYELHRRMSVQSYTALRRDSVDSVFSAFQVEMLQETRSMPVIQFPPTTRRPRRPSLGTLVPSSILRAGNKTQHSTTSVSLQATSLQQLPECSMNDNSQFTMSSSALPGLLLAGKRPRRMSWDSGVSTPGPLNQPKTEDWRSLGLHGSPPPPRFDDAVKMSYVSAL